MQKLCGIYRKAGSRSFSRKVDAESFWNLPKSRFWNQNMEICQLVPIGSCPNLSIAIHENETLYMTGQILTTVTKKPEIENCRGVQHQFVPGRAPPERRTIPEAMHPFLNAFLLNSALFVKYDGF